MNEVLVALDKLRQMGARSAQIGEIHVEFFAPLETYEFVPPPAPTQESIRLGADGKTPEQQADLYGRPVYSDFEGL